MTVAILAVSALLVPTSAQAANVESRGVYIDASGRAGSKIVVTVMSKLVTGSTSTTDTAWAYVSEGPYGVARYDRNFAISAAPIRIVNSVAYFQIVLNSESAGTYTVYAGIRSQDSGLNFAYGWDCGVSCRYTSTAFQVGGTVDRVKFASRNLAISPSLSSNVEDLTPTGLVLFDAEGNRTLLSDDETIQLTTQTAPAGSAPTFAAGNETQLSTPGSSQLAITSASNNGDGIFRFKVGNSTAGITVIQGIVSDSNGAIASSNFQITGTTNAIPGKSVKVLSSNSANESMYASGSDGKLYEWGAHEVGLKDAVTSLDVDKRTLIKPTKIDFPHAASGTSKNSVDQLIRNYDSGWNNYFGHYVLADDGTLWGFRKSGISNEQTLSGNLEPVFTFNLNSNYITQAGGNAKLFLLADGTTLTRDSNWKFSVPDLGSIGNPVITQISYMNGSGVSLFLATDGKLYSSGTNAYGELGQGSDTATALGQVVLPTNRIISKLYAGTRFGVVKMVDGSYWSWGDNRGGQQGKLASEVPYSNTPRVVITPANFSVNDIQVDKQIVLIGTSQFYTSYNGNWQLNLAANAGLPNGSQISAFSGDGIDEISYSYINGYLIADNSGNVYQYGGPTGSCGNNYGRIRSYGQFGETFLGDNVQSGSKFYIDSSTTSQISGAISVKVNTPFSLQVANVRTSCYQTSELSFAWDKDGNSTFETPDIATVGDTGYFGLNASLNFSTPGRRKITLGVTTPDEITLQVPFTIGVEPETRTVLSAIDTSTATIVSDGGTTIALTKSGGVYAWGANDFGQLGVSPSLYTRRNIPMPLSLPDTATPASVAVQNGNTLVVDTLGRVWGFGIANSIDGTSGTYTSARQVTSLKSVKVRLIKDNFVLTTDGKMLVWNPNDRSLVSIPSLAGIYIKNFAYQGYIQGCGATPTQMSRNLLNAVDINGNVWRVPLSINFVPGEAEAISIENAIEIEGYGSKAVIKSSNGDIYFSSYAGCDFGLVTKPAGTTMLDVALYSLNSSMIAMTDTLRNVWTASIEQGTGVFQPGTWTKLAAIDA
ncbi:MAG: hypothetical protein F2803_06105, partial [Actinobacteria bacterium]|nr:hypothetical protein [Actinomycetota bacterium]